MRYKADITKCSLCVPESRIISGLLLDGIEGTDWSRAISVENVLQKRSAFSAKTVAGLTRARLRTMGPEIWKMVRDGDSILATQAVFACAVKHSPLLGDFLLTMVQEQLRLFKKELIGNLWSVFLEECRTRDRQMPVWTEKTTAKLGSRVYEMLRQVGYIGKGKTPSLRPVVFRPELIDILEKNAEHYTLKCMGYRNAD